MSNVIKFQLIEKKINRGAEDAKDTITEFTKCVAVGDMQEAEKLREKALILQGELMDNICAKILLMRRLGMEVKIT